MSQEDLEKQLEYARHRVRQLSSEQERLLAELQDSRKAYEEIRRSLSWRVTAPLRAFGGLFSSGAVMAGRVEESSIASELTSEDRRVITAQINGLTQRPLFILTVTVREPALEPLKKTLDSLVRQLYGNWRVDLLGPAVVGMPAYGSRVGPGEPGDFVAFIESGDTLAETGLYEMAVEIEAHPDAVLLYSDEEGRFKTGWNPDLLLAQDYIGQLALFRRTALDGLGDLVAHELKLGVTEVLEPSRIRHIPAVLFKAARPSDPPASKRMEWPKTDAKVSIIIPNRDRASLLRRCLEGLFERTRYPNLEVIVVDHESRETDTLALLDQYRGHPNFKVIPHTGEFNWSAMNNSGARVATGEILLFLNNDTEVTDPNWLSELASQAMRPEIGVAGAKLLYPDGTLQHAGIWCGPHGAVRHFLRGANPSDAPQVAQNLSAVTGACMAVRKSVWQEVGGFEERLPVAYNDVDFCFRVLDAGYRVLWTPFAEMLHLESASRDDRFDPADPYYRLFYERWRARLDQDPFFNPNLDLDPSGRIVKAISSRRGKPYR